MLLNSIVLQLLLNPSAISHTVLGLFTFSFRCLRVVQETFPKYQMTFATPEMPGSISTRF